MSSSFNLKSDYCYDHFLKNTPNMISNGLFQRIFGHSFKEISHCFICCKSLCNRENIILQCNQGSGGNLRSKVAGCNGSVHGNILFRCSRYASRFGIVRIIHDQTGVIVADLQITDKRVKFTNQPIS